MKQALKNEIDVLNLINKLQEQLIALDKKVDILVHRSMPETRLPPKPPVNNAPSPGKQRYQVICADCKKECTIPFKPSGDRPVYCQDCFSRRKVIHMSGIKLENKTKEAAPVQIAVNDPVKTPKTQAKKKKVVTVKKSITKKKSAPKKK